VKTKVLFLFVGLCIKKTMAVALERADYLDTEDFDYLMDCYPFDPMIGGRPLTMEIIS
jgi:hypothetical protein